MIILQITKEELKDCLKEAVNEAVLRSNRRGSAPKPPKELMGLKELCEEFGWAPPTVYAWTSKNLIPHIRKSKKLFFVRSDIIDWLKEGRVKTKAEIMEEVEGGGFTGSRR